MSMEPYPLLVKLINSDPYWCEDENGRPFIDYKNFRKRYTIITCDDEYADIAESCGASEGCMSMQVLGHVPFADMKGVGNVLLTTANKYYKRNAIRCPCCGSNKIEAKEAGGDTDSIWEICSCLNCNHSWNNIYTFCEQILDEE